METKRDCAFQYAKMSGSIFKDIKMVSDETRLTLDEAKNLWNKHFPDCAKHIKNGGTVEMVIWINMETSSSYVDTLEYISTDAESDGYSVWETRKTYFTKEFKK